MNLPDHGANPRQLAEEIGAIIEGELLDFSTNTSVIRHPLLDTIGKSNDFSDYPDPNHLTMKKTLSSVYGLPKDHFLITNGANEAIYLVASYCSKKQVGIIVPTYPEYEKALEAYGASVVPIPSSDFGEALIRDDHGLWEVLGQLDILFLCNPNNPTGTYYDEEQLSMLKALMKTCDLTVVLDESYIDFVLTKTVEAYKKPLWDMEQTIILRSLTKNFQLAGIRIAYAMSSPFWIRQLSRRQPTWSVNTLAMDLAHQLLTDHSFLKEMHGYYVEETKRFRESLEQIGIPVMASDVHFFLIQTEDDMRLIQWLLTKGIAVRHTRNHKGLDGRYIRVATKTVKENDYFIRTMIRAKWKG